jgi:hypothetical protein
MARDAIAEAPWQQTARQYRVASAERSCAASNPPRLHHRQFAVHGPRDCVQGPPIGACEHDPRRAWLIR